MRERERERGGAREIEKKREGRENETKYHYLSYPGWSLPTAQTTVMLNP